MPEARQPKGIPVGGQYAPTSHPETAIDLKPTSTLPADTQREVRGHDFYPADVVSWPGLYETDNGSAVAEKPFVAHYFHGGMDWYIAEIDQKNGEAFGYVDLGYGGEFGYIDMQEL